MSWEFERQYIDATASMKAHEVGVIITMLISGLSVVYGANIIATRHEVELLKQRIEAIERPLGEEGE